MPFGDRVLCHNKAVWRSDQPQQLLFNDPLTGLNKSNTGGISVLWNNEGIQVASVSLDELLAEASRNFDRRVRLLKLDCEGSEYPILFTSRHLEIVDEICGEYHVISPEEVPDRALTPVGRDQYNGFGLKEFLEEEGFSVVLEPHSDTVGVFHARRPRRLDLG
jgi:FkbM family methyltransferase